MLLFLFFNDLLFIVSQAQSPSVFSFQFTKSCILYLNNMCSDLLITHDALLLAMGTGSSTTAEMASVTVCNCTIQGRSERIVLSFVNLKGSVCKLKDEVSRTINLPISDIGIMKICI